MPRKYMERNVATTTIYLSEVQVVNGEITSNPLPEITVQGKVNREKANRLAKQYHKGLQVVVTDVKTKEEKYRMSVDDFVKNASKVVE